MFLIQEKIKEYLSKNNISLLCKETGLGHNTFYRILKNENRFFQKKSLDIIYNFFGLQKDDFYQKNFEKVFKKNNYIFGDFLKIKRMEKNISIKEMSLKTKISENAFFKIEKGAFLPSKYFLGKYFEILEFGEKEKKYIENFLNGIALQNKSNNFFQKEFLKINQKINEN